MMILTIFRFLRQLSTAGRRVPDSRWFSLFVHTVIVLLKEREDKPIWLKVVILLAALGHVRQENNMAR
jgi:hypothetical protein